MILDQIAHPQEYQGTRQDFELTKTGFVFSQVDAIHHQVLVVCGHLERLHQLNKNVSCIVVLNITFYLRFKVKISPSL